jgi:Mg-chelatase subunit ChlI
MCGRLRCCLVYEYEQYVEARKQLPKRNKRVVTPKGEGKVLDVLPLADKVMVAIDAPEGERSQIMTFTREEIQPWDELEALRRKSEAPCDRHEGGGCTCGKDNSNAKNNTSSPSGRDETNNNNSDNNSGNSKSNPNRPRKPRHQA